MSVLYADEVFSVQHAWLPTPVKVGTLDPESIKILANAVFEYIKKGMGDKLEVPSASAGMKAADPPLKKAWEGPKNFQVHSSTVSKER